MAHQPNHDWKQSHSVRRQAAQPNKKDVQATSPQPLAARLQRSLGNQALGQLAGQVRIQTRLTLGPVGDRYEQEADQVAKQVVQSMDAPAHATGNGAATAQRQTEPPTEEEDPAKLAAKRLDHALQRATTPTVGALEEEQLGQAKPAIQRTASSDAGPVSADVESAIQRERGNGSPLAEGVRAPMERAFGADFGGVNIHTGNAADSLNQSLQARAFTTGKDIFFRQGEYNPESSGGKELLAHELTHVVQQTGNT